MKLQIITPVIHDGSDPLSEYMFVPMHSGTTYISLTFLTGEEIMQTDQYRQFEDSLRKLIEKQNQINAGKRL